MNTTTTSISMAGAKKKEQNPQLCSSLFMEAAKLAAIIPSSDRYHDHFLSCQIMPSQMVTRQSSAFER